MKRRLSEHNSGTGSRYTRARLPVKIAFQTETSNRSLASKIEFQIKQLSRSEKIKIIKHGKISETDFKIKRKKNGE